MASLMKYFVFFLRCIFFLIMCMRVLMDMDVIFNTGTLRKPEEEVGFSEARIMNSFEPPDKGENQAQVLWKSSIFS